MKAGYKKLLVGVSACFAFCLLNITPARAFRADIFIPHFDTRLVGYWGTGVVMINMGTAAATATVEAFNDDGNSLGTMDLTIPVRGREAFDIGTIFGAGSGWLKITADQPLVAFDVFSDFQMGGFAALNGVSAGSKTVFIPHFDTTAGDWWTGVAVANVGTAATTATVEAFDGELGISLGTMNLTIPFNGRKAFDVGTIFGVNRGWLKITAEQPLAAMQLFIDLPSGGTAALNGVNAVSPIVFIPHFDSTPGDWWTGVMVANAGTAATTAAVEAFDGELGISLGTTYMTIPSMGRKAFEVGTTVGANRGWLKITADQPLAATELFGDLPSGGIAGVNGVSAVSSTVIIPLFDTTAGQWWTGVMVANAGTAATTATLEAFAGDGSSLGTMNMTIPVMGRKAFGMDTTSIAGRGWLKITADQPLAALELFSDQSDFLAGLEGVPFQ